MKLKIFAMLNGMVLILVALVIATDEFFESASRVAPIIKDSAPLFSFFGVLCVGVLSAMIAFRIENHRYSFKIQELQTTKDYKLEELRITSDLKITEAQKARFYDRRLECYEKLSRRIVGVVDYAHVLYRELLDLDRPTRPGHQLSKNDFEKILNEGCEKLTKKITDIGRYKQLIGLYVEYDVNLNVEIFCKILFRLNNSLRRAFHQPHSDGKYSEIESTLKDLMSQYSNVGESMHRSLEINKKTTGVRPQW